MSSNLEKIQKLMNEKNSDLTISDTKDENTGDQDKNIKLNKRVHKKPLALKELENKDRLMSLKKKHIHETNSDEVKTDDMNTLLEKETKEIFNKSWNKLEKGLKFNRINKYLDTLKEEHSLTDQDIKEVKIMLFAKVSKGGLTKNTEVSYNKETAVIVKINPLYYDEKKKKLLMKKDAPKKAKSTGRSKSNIERLLKH